jgi:DNA-binding GntR family transcriptional regulator
MTNLREKAYGSFTSHLLARDLRAGQFISQRELVELTGLPLGAIRELIPRLETEGLIQTVPKRGMRVTHVDLNLIRDAFQFRMFLETGAVALFAETASDAMIAGLSSEHNDIVNECRIATSISKALIEKAQAIDWNLHATLIDALGNEIVADAYRVNAIKIRLIKQEQTRLNEAVILSTMIEHIEIIDAIATRDPGHASNAMRSHILNARRRALNQI